MSNMNLVPVNRLKRNKMDLSYKHLFSGDMGILYPVGWKYCIPGDKVRCGSNVFLRMMPMVAPILTNVRVKTRTFFMPFTAMKGPDEDFNFQDFYKQGRDGKDNTMKIPKWFPTSTANGSLWNFLIGPDVELASADVEHHPDKFLLWLYNYIVNHYFISPDIEEPRDLEDETLFRVNWRKDYFGGCTLQQQRGVSPTLPTQVSYLGTDDEYHQAYMSSLYSSISGAADVAGNVLHNESPAHAGTYVTYTQNAIIRGNPLYKATAKNPTVVGTGNEPLRAVVTNSPAVLPKDGLEPLVTTPVSVNDLRLAFAVQRYLETNNRAGSRYVDQLKVRFGIAPRDENLLEPQFIGGSTTPIIISEVLQTSESNETPQGNMAGHGITIDRSYAGSYTCKDFGIVMTMMYVVPDVEYVSQGIDRQLLTNSYLDLYSPELANLGDMPVQEVELYAQDTAAKNSVTFGFRGVWDWMRFSRNRVSGKLAADLSFWHLAREFNTAPNLNTDFIKCNPKKDFLAVPTEDTFICEFLNIYKFRRPIPKFAIPRM